MRIEKLEGTEGYRIFSNLGRKIYNGNPYYRGTEASIEKLLLLGPTSFHKHSTVMFFIVEDENEMVARFALIHDKKLPGYIQVSFFEALPGINGLWNLIKSEARKHFNDVSKVVVGLNGHLNYGAGFLINHFNEDPLFGLPYSHKYYPDYFKDLNARVMVTFRFPMSKYIKWFNRYNIKRLIKDVKTRNMNKKNIKKEIETYTILNNKCFQQHLYWANREIEEDLELFYPFRHLLKNENLIFAEYSGVPIGFFLWYPDFNQLVKGSRDLNALDLVRFKAGAKIDVFRFAEIGVLPEYRGTSVNISLIQHAVPYIEKAKIKYCECGFIFEENKESITMMKRFMKRFFNHEVEPYRKFAVYEGELWK
jgi:GNAT superfamily N-acetyltransferase